MKKKVFALFAACLVFISIVTQASAASVTRNVRISALVKLPVISIVVPTTGIVYMNPRSLPVKLQGKVDSSTIVNVPWAIENRSEVPIQVDASVEGTIKSTSDMTLSNASVANSTTTLKRAFMYLSCQRADPGDDINDLSWPAFDPQKNIVVSTSTRSKKNILTLAAGNEDGTTAEGGVGVFRLSGDVTPNPREAWNPAKDLVNVAITFTFVPLPKSET